MSLNARAIEDFRFPYETVVTPERFGDQTLQVERLKSLDETIDALFTELQRSGSEDWLDRLCPYFGQVWPSGRALTEVLREMNALTPLKGARILEVGCGLALPALMACKLGATVLATDFHPEVPRFLERNKALNGVGPELQFLSQDWQKEERKLGEFDWVIGSDILYERQHPEWVAKAIARQLSPQTRILIADPARPYLQGFADAMAKESGLAYENWVHRLPEKDVFILKYGQKT